MTPGEMMQVEALRTSALGVFHVARGLVQALDAMLLQKTEEQEPNAYSTFDSDDSPTTEHQHGTQKLKRGRKLG